MSWMDEDIMRILDDRGPMTAPQISTELEVHLKKVYERLATLKTYKIVREVGMSGSSRLWNVDHRDIMRRQ